jgi:ADP-ribosylglycohydrolase
MDLIAGSLLGLAVGDALGAPLEGMRGPHIGQVFGEVADYVDPIAAFPDRPGKWRLAGLYTDEAQQALAVADVLAVHGGADAQVLADLYLRLANEGPPGAPFGGHRGTGHFFRRAVAAMAAADDPRRCGQPSAGSGAAVRVAPVGLFYAEDEEALARSAIDLSLMTHCDSRGVAAALAMARAVACLAPRGGDEKGRERGRPERSSPDPLRIAEDLPGWLAEWETRLAREYREFLDLQGDGDARLHMFSEALTPLAFLVRESNDALAAKSIVEQANACAPAAKITQLNASFAPALVVMALYRALSAVDFASGLIATVNAGGDADTAGAVTGALLGARFGVDLIPARWIEGLLNADQIRLRARALAERGVDWSAWEDYVEMEKALTERELAACRRAEAEHHKAIERRKEREAERRASRAKTAAKAPPPDLGFAPPPEIWLGGLRPPSDDAASDGIRPADPVQAKKDKARRGRRRIAWKEERRKGKR